MIIGITGTLGAGKGTVVEYLKTKGFKHFSARDFFTKEVARRGLPVSRDSMVLVANDLRALHGPGFFAESAIDYARERGGDVVVESIRSIGEAEYLKSHGAALWAVDADIQKRYERIFLRASETDKVSFEKFVEHEQREFTNTDPAKQNLSGVMKMADAVLVNNGTQEELFAQVEAILKKYTH
jgi:dephospho-CoA kinase